jgi:two-component system, NarL family, nitrate/nitrite response regulator NarL
MRVLLVGSPPERARLRARLNGSMDVAGEFDSLAAARASEADSDAILMAPDASDVEEGEVDEPLTPREVQVLELLAEGLPNKAIAVRLHISDQTVKFHVSSISGKLAAKNRTDAVRRAVRRGLITL